MSGPQKIPEKGKFLLAEPFLLDPNFKRAVVLLAEHTEEGSVGFILNRPTNLTMGEAMPDFPLPDFRLYMGGPVQPETLHFIHRIEDLKDGSMEIRKGLYWGGDFDRLKELARQGDIKNGDVRFFLGYSGWGAEQLGDEMKAKSWIVSSSSPRFAFSETSGDLWQQVLRKMGGRYRVISNYPPDPSLN